MTNEKTSVDTKVKTNVSDGLLGKKELYAISIGTVIGAGVFTVLGSAIAVTGKSTWLAYMVAVLLGFALNLPMLIAASMAKLKGGYYSMVSELMGEKWGGMYLLAYIPVSFSYSLFGLGLGQYVNALLPSVSPKLMGVLVITVFFVLNLFPIKNMAKTQKTMTWILISTLIMFVVFGLPKVNMAPFDFGSSDYFLGGASGFLTAVILLVYSTTSYIQVINFGGAAKRPKKDIPFAIILSGLTILFVYAGAAIVATGILPISEVASKPLTFVADVILPKPLFIVLIAGGVIMALATTLNSMFGSFGRIFMQGSADGWFPDWLAKTNKHGQPFVLFTITYLIGVLPIILGFNIKTITNNIVLMSYAMGLLPRISMLIFPKRYPEICANSKSYGNKGIFYTINIISLILHIIVTYLSASALNATIVTVSLSALAACAIYAVLRSKSGKVQIQNSFDVS